MNVARPSTTVARASAGGFLLLAAIVSALLYYKWGASLRAVTAVHQTGTLSVKPGILLEGGVLATTLAYLGKIWPALTYGILVGAAVRSAIPATAVQRWLGGRGVAPTLAGALAGAPLMLCSCCITPVFSGLYRRGARLGPSLAVMLASPG
ncbi:MAG TPA: permease, partial [Polyangiaceae bacterium]